MMSVEDLAALATKLDMILDRLNRMENAMIAQQVAIAAQQVAMNIRIDHLKQEVDRMIGGRLNPYWIYAIMTGGGLLVGYLTGARVAH